MTQLLVHGGTVLTQDQDHPVAGALLVDGANVVAVGDDGAVAAQARAGAERLDLAGRTVTPGFIDVHNHFYFGVFAELGVDCRTPPVATVGELLEGIAEAVARTPKRQWVRGWGYNELDLRDGRHPTRAELDELAPDNPVVIEHASGHMCVANSLALTAAGIGEATPNPHNGVIVRDRSGRVTGLMHECASEMIDVAAREAILAADPEGWIRAAYSVARRYASLGLTCVCDPCVPASVEPLYRRLVADADFPVELVGLGMGAAGKFADPADRFDDSNEDGGFSISGIKFFADGGEQCAVCMSRSAVVRSAVRTVANSIRHRTLLATRLFGAPVSRLGGDGNVHSGIKFYDDTRMVDLLQRTVGRGWTAAVHAMGNEAIDQVLDAVEATRRHAPDEAAFRMEHVMMPAEASLPRVADLGVAAVVQPRFVHDYGFPLILTGLDREFRVLAFRDLIDLGVVVAGSSDAPVSDPAVLPAIESAVTRRTQHGEVLGRDQSISVEQALALYTTNAASVLRLDARGALRPGAVADFVVLDADPRTVPPERIGQVGVTATYRRGRPSWAM